MSAVNYKVETQAVSGVSIGFVVPSTKTKMALFLPKGWLFENVCGKNDKLQANYKFYLLGIEKVTAIFCLLDMIFTSPI